jgi:hypothetical protein
MCQRRLASYFFVDQKTLFASSPSTHQSFPPTTPIKVHNLTRDELAECQLKGLFYNCDEKYFLGHRCKEHKFFMAISEDVVEEEDVISLVKELPRLNATLDLADPPEVEPLISLNSLSDFFSPQTLKLIGYIKHRKFTILIDSGSTHNFIHRRIAQETNCYIDHVVNNFQIMIDNGGCMKCVGRCENVCLQIG